MVEKRQLRTDPSKVAAVKDWPLPTTCKQLQWFLGFTNFYRRFIRKYCCLAAPLTCLASPKLPFTWSLVEQQAFEKLKNMFVNAPALTYPDPEWQFVVEVDGLDSWVGAVLSQSHPTDKKLHPCTFFSHRLCPVESNYDMTNREPLAMDPWRRRYWLEGGTQPFFMWTDHKNFAYLCTTCRLNPRQARWALFQGKFRFTITYRAGSRNTNSDALSRQFSSEERESSKQTILDPECVLGEVHWLFEAEVQEALQGQTVPDGCPSLLFVPQSTRSLVLSWGTPPG